MIDNGYANLLAQVKLELYSNNPFRLAELPVGASQREINKRSQIITMALANNLPVPPGTGRALPLDPAPEADQVETALQSITDPEKRLYAEFFWFWPKPSSSSGMDPALAALGRFEIEQAVELWKGPEYQEVATHNLAVLYHCRALDLELKTITRVLSLTQLQRLQEYWQQAFQHWQALLDEDGFWTLLQNRIVEIDDPRVTQELAGSIKVSLPQALLTLSASILIGHLQVNSTALADLQLQTIKGSGFKPEDIEEVYSLTVQPLRNKISLICNESADKADAKNGSLEVVSQLINKTSPLLSIFDRLLPLKNPLVIAVHDEVASGALRLLVKYANKTESWKETLPLLYRVRRHARGEVICSRIDETISTITTNLFQQAALEKYRAKPTTLPSRAPAAATNYYSSPLTREPYRVPPSPTSYKIGFAIVLLLCSLIVGLVIYNSNNLKGKTEPTRTAVASIPTTVPEKIAVSSPDLTQPPVSTPTQPPVPTPTRPPEPTTTPQPPATPRSTPTPLPTSTPRPFPTPTIPAEQKFYLLPVGYQYAIVLANTAAYSAPGGFIKSYYSEDTIVIFTQGKGDCQWFMTNSYDYIHVRDIESFYNSYQEAADALSGDGDRYVLKPEFKNRRSCLK